ncbi:hypothetical protein KAR91_53640 [Candidatus Pacearchaeota archaeon]|nr:hypothetical protein [Candidatus Pacearchaeota archaeon]
MGHRIIETGEVLPRRAPFKINGISYSKDELWTSDPERLAQIGVEYFEDPIIPPEETPEWVHAQRRLEISDTKMPRALEDFYKLMLSKGIITELEIAPVVLQLISDKEADRIIVVRDKPEEIE